MMSKTTRRPTQYTHAARIFSDSADRQIVYERQGKYVFH